MDGVVSAPIRFFSLAFMKIAVDAMGGDYAPEAIVEGSVQAAEEYGFPLVLVGQEDRVRQELWKYRTDHLKIEVKHAAQVVEMHDLPSYALRRKKESSLHVGIHLLKQGEADAFVSAGNTGAVMAISKLICRMLPGIDRPALATVLPNINGVTILIDVGANVDCKPLHLLQFAVMGQSYAKHVFGIHDPRIGLLSIGEEETKGNVLTKEVFEPLSKSKLNFLGNAEGRDVFNGRADVVVCDGFIGNIVLKVSESLAKTMGTFLKEGFSKNWWTKLGYLLVKPGMDDMRKRVDYTEYGGAPLLGVNGVVIISHGSSKAKAIKNAIRVAAESVNHHNNEHILDLLAQCEFDTKSRAKATSLWRQLKETIRHDSDKEKNQADKKVDKKKEQEPDKEQVSSESAEISQNTVEEAEGKKSWWHLKQRGENDKNSEKQFDDQEEKQDPEQIQNTESIPPPESNEQNIPAVEEPEEEKKPWWYLRRSSEKDQNDSEKTPTQKEQKEQAPLLSSSENMTERQEQQQSTAKEELSQEDKKKEAKKKKSP